MQKVKKLTQKVLTAKKTDAILNLRNRKVSRKEQHMTGEFRTDHIELKKIMIEKGYKTIKELSEKSGVNRNTLAAVVNGEKQPSSDVMERLVIALDIEPEKAGKIFFSRILRTA